MKNVHVSEDDFEIFCSIVGKNEYQRAEIESQEFTSVLDTKYGHVVDVYYHGPNCENWCCAGMRFEWEIPRRLKSIPSRFVSIENITHKMEHQMLNEWNGSKMSDGIGDNLQKLKAKGVDPFEYEQFVHDKVRNLAKEMLDEKGVSRSIHYVVPGFD